MIEYMHARVRVNNFTMFTVINLIGAVGNHVSPWNGVYNADKYSLFDLNVQNKRTSTEYNSNTSFLKLRATDLGRHEKYDY